MDTFVEISCFSSAKDLAVTAMKEAFKEIERIEKVFNKFDQESEISKINNLAGSGDMVISLELFGIIERSIYYSNISGGSFDVTVRSAYKGRYEDILLNKDRLSIRFLDNDIKIDLGAIVKGYAVDKARMILESHGIKNALINIGGNIYAMGNPPGKKAWRVGIQDPSSKTAIIHKLSLRNRGVSTSGGYERPSHIIDPESGKPVKKVMSVTVVADSAEKADALSTAVFVMGAEKGLELIKSLSDVKVFIFDRNGKLITYP